MKAARRMFRTAEHVGAGHPDKFCDRVADRILDETLRQCGSDLHRRQSVRTAIECLVKDNMLVVSGEVRWLPEMLESIDITALAREVWEQTGYGSGKELAVINNIRSQSPDIANGSGNGVDHGGAGDQGIMVGFACDETPEMMPSEYMFSRNMCMKLDELRRSGALPWLRADTKTQVTIDPDGMPVRFIVAAQHDDPKRCGVSRDEMREQIFAHVVRPILGDRISADLAKINGTGEFIIGGPAADAGVVGRKIVVDAYGPRVPVGGGAYSGKDPTKVDRSAAYMARHIAKAVVANKIGGASMCQVSIAYGIGQIQPEMVTAMIDTGEDVSGWVNEQFSDLSPRSIIEQLELTEPNGWSYFDTAAGGHYGRMQFPWERVERENAVGPVRPRTERVAPVVVF